jgi:N6-adenosine-specific RNA methylase IME4
MTAIAIRDAGLPATMERVRRFLAETGSIGEIARLHDLAEAARRYADSHEAQNYAAEVKLRCARRAGELLAGDPGFGPGKKSTTLVDFGLAQSVAFRWQRMATVPGPQFETWLGETDEVTAAGLLRLAKVERRGRRDAALPPPTVNGELATKTYATIVADPPWQYGNTATRGAAEDHYPTMTAEALARLSVEVDKWADPDCHLYLWTTNNFVREAFDVVDGWGFDYKTMLTWVKPQIGMGNYFRSRTEHILFAIRGELGTQRRDISNVVEAKRTQHSRKPDAFYDLVEAQSPGPYLEMFARRRRLGWDNWGNEA